MKEPSMITAKDLSYIKDMFNWHLIAAKKLQFYLNDTIDNETTKLFKNLKELHYKHCQTLIDILESGDE
ncbi:MAG: hypothetical protein E7172_01585 [Firmicutes bacterium]|nr:hypothetical protein [Bacillota bacterium]